MRLIVEYLFLLLKVNVNWLFHQSNKVFNRQIVQLLISFTRNSCSKNARKYVLVLMHTHNYGTYPYLEKHNEKCETTANGHGFVV